MEGLNPGRVCQVWTEAAIGSGYLVAPTLVLTAAHVVRGDHPIEVVVGPAEPSEHRSPALVRWPSDGDGVAEDLAVLELISPMPGAVDAVGFGRLSDRNETVAATALGFPRWKLREDTDGVFRDYAHVAGKVQLLSNRRSRTLELTAGTPPDPDPQRSPWSGFSGSAVWVGDRIVGIVAEHHRREGLGTLSLTRMDALLSRRHDAATDRLRQLLEVTSPHTLAEVTDGRTPAGGYAAAGSNRPLIISQRMSSVPHHPNEDIADAIGSVASDHPIVLVGAAGTGKSTAASIFVNRLLLTNECDLAWWVDASSSEFIVQHLAELAGDLLGAEAPDEAESAARAALRRVVSGDRRCVIVYDNANDPQVLMRWLPKGPARVVVTTRDPAMGGAGIGPTIHVTDWEHQACLDYLSPGELVPEDQAALDELLSLIGGLPLALSAVRVQKAKPGRRWRDVLRDVRRPGRLAPIDHLTSLFEASMADAAAQAEAAPRLLGLLAFLYTEDLRLDAVQEFLDDTFPGPADWGDARAALFDNGLLKVANSSDELHGDDTSRAVMHSLIADFARRRHPSSLHDAAAFVAAVGSEPATPALQESDDLRRWHAHLGAVADYVIDAANGSGNAAPLVDRLFLGVADFARREAEAAEHRLQHETLRTCMRLIDAYPSIRQSRPVEVSNTVFQLLVASMLRGAFDELDSVFDSLLEDPTGGPITALDELFRSMALAVSATATIWTDDPWSAGQRLIDILDHVASIGQSPGAERMPEVVGAFSDALSTLCLEMFIAALTISGQPQRALELLADVPPIDSVEDEQIVDFPYVRVGEALISAGRAPEAAAILRSAVAAHNRLMSPPADLNLLELRGYLSVALSELGHIDEAQALLTENLQIFSEHSLHMSIDFAEQTGFLGLVELRSGRAGAAAVTLGQSIRLYERFAPSDHPAILTCRRHLADALLANGDPNGALVEVDRVLTGFEIQRGANHPSVTQAKAARDQIVAAVES